ncbi:MAG TPA: hypothetical protein DGO43_09600, partial [Chloroflexi bacterium]|nr:hypothetical protein [Chloroflexota bacterium]
ASRLGQMLASRLGQMWASRWGRVWGWRLAALASWRIHSPPAVRRRGLERGRSASVDRAEEHLNNGNYAKNVM